MERVGRKENYMFESNMELGIVLFLFIYSVVVSFMLLSRKRKESNH